MRVAMAIGLAWLGLAGCQATPGTANAPTCEPDTVVFEVEGTSLAFPADAQLGTALPGEFGARYVLQQWAEGDLDGDGDTEQLAVIVMTGAGSGSFYYLAASASAGCEAHALGSVFLGDRIQVEALRVLPPGHVDAGWVILDLAFHGAEQPMSASPNIRVSRQFRLQNARLIQLEHY